MGRKPVRAASTAAAPPRRQLRIVVIQAVLVALTFFVFAQVTNFEFISLDDPQFVTGNPHVTAGLKTSSVKWALTSAELGYYPLTWLSHMADVQFFALDAGDHHLTAVLLHAASAIVLFLALLRLTSAIWPSAFVAALFAIHPMHVESVAWISERKDTLSTLFGFLALYVYAKRPRHWLVAAFLAMSLLSKQMLVTFPIVLLAIDWWVAGRWSPVAGQRSITADVDLAWRLRTSDQRPATSDHLATSQLLIEKWPLFALSLAATFIAVVGQKQLAAIQPLDVQPFGQRIANALVAYVLYLAKLFVPVRLAVFYPMVERNALAAIGAALLLAAITFAAWRLRNRAPYFIAGWAWFVITLLPVIGIVQIGPQAMADRYSYVPSIGIFIAVAWAAYELLPRQAAAASAIAVIVIFSAVAWKQTSYWHDSRTLFAHSLEVTGPNAQIDYLIGQTLATTDPDAALPPLRRAVNEIETARLRNPNAPQAHLLSEAHISLGTALLVKAGLSDRDQALPLIADAEREYRIVQSLVPNDPLKRAPYNLALADEMRKKLLGHGDDAESLMSAGAQLLAANRLNDAVAQFRRATASAPNLPESHIYLAIALLRASRNAEAAQELRTAQSLNEVKANESFTTLTGRPFDEHNLRNEIAQLSR